MRSTMEVEGGARMTFEDVSEEALTEAVSGLLASRFFISSTYKEMDKDEIAPEDPDRPSQGRAGLGPRRFRTVKNASKKAVAVAERVLADGEWHSRSEVVAGCHLPSVYSLQ